MQVQWKDLNIQRQIGEGSFGKVYLAKWRETTVAVKVLISTQLHIGTEDDEGYVLPQPAPNPLLCNLVKVRDATGSPLSAMVLFKSP
jgi:serine/threonine protein kinase